MSSTAFYVYVLFRENGTPFYVGKGSNYRWMEHEKKTRQGAKGQIFSIIRRIHALGMDLPKIKLHEGLTETTAFSHEAAIIAAIGRKPYGPLVNLTNGGDGARGVTIKPETRIKLAEAQRGKTYTPEAREKMATAKRGRKLSPEQREKMSMAHRGKTQSPEHIAKRAAAYIGFRHTPETRARLRAANIGKKLSPETRAKISAGNRGKKRLPFSQEHREKLAAAQRNKKGKSDHGLPFPG